MTSGILAAETAAGSAPPDDGMAYGGAFSPRARPGPSPEFSTDPADVDAAQMVARAFEAAVAMVEEVELEAPPTLLEQAGAAIAACIHRTQFSLRGPIQNREWVTGP